MPPTKTKKSSFNSGIGNNARDQWSGSRITPNQEQQLMGFFVGQVMDDRDEQRMGRVWVYIPQISGKRFDDQSLPTYGGTTPDRQEVDLEFDAKLRSGWIMVSPMSPFFGSDGFRNATAPDGRNSQGGDVNSYGMWHQPRIGDFVGIAFAGGDPNSGYWMGMVPRQYSNGMVPGNPGTEAQNVSPRETNELLPVAQSTAMLSTMDRVPTDTDPTHSDPILSTDLARAQMVSGVSGDPVRGAGTSGARRESPSYVTGLKSAGWSFGSERNNRNVDGTAFGDNTEQYYNKNSVGHSFVMDDHPDHQSMRMRTSSGSQILMFDACTNPLIYLQTANGNVWMEMSDSGDLSIYAANGIHLHAEKDFNLTVDGNMNVGVRGNYNLRIAGNSVHTVGGMTDEAHAGPLTKSIEGDYDLNVGTNARMTYGGDLHTRTPGSLFFTGGGGMDVILGGGIRQSAGGSMDFNVAGNTRFFTGGNQDMTIGGGMQTSAGGASLMSAGGGVSIQAGGSIDMDGSTVNLNSGTSSAAAPETGEEFTPADRADMPILPPMNKTARSPNQSEIAGNSAIELTDSAASVVPQHQPWGKRCGYGSSGGTNGLVSSSASDGGLTTRSPNSTCDRTNNSNNVRTGSGFFDSLVPDFIQGGLSKIAGLLPVSAVADGYRTDKPGEKPNYRSVRLPLFGETFKASDLRLSQEGLEFIKGNESLITTPKLDPVQGGYVVGYGHRVSYGDTIAGTFLDSDTLRRISSFSNDSEKALRVTPEEADSYLSQELAPIEEWVQNTFAEVEFTQKQFDTLVSFARNVSPEVLEKEETGKKFIEELNKGNFDAAQPAMYEYSHVGGSVDCNVLDRRRSEAAAFGQPTDYGGITAQAIGYVPQGETVTLAGFKIESAVFNAICNAYQSVAPQLPDGYLFAICAQESAFVPTAKASTSSAAGLFQFINDTGAQYGLQPSNNPSSNVFDPVANANAGAKFNLDNMNYAISKGVANVGPTELYALHFLGIGGGTSFLLSAQSNPGGIAANGHPKAAAANRNIFYVKGDTGNPRSYAEVYNLLKDKIEKRVPYFAGVCNNAPPPVDPPGDFQWTTGSRAPNFYKVDPRIRAIAEKSAVEAGITSLPFNSGFRDPATNEANDGAQNSQHLYGKAIDIHVGNLSVDQQRAFAERLAANGVTGFGVGTNTFHVDIRDAGRVTWQYRGGNGRVRDILQKYGYRGA